jgi:hypothetical protein
MVHDMIEVEKMGKPAVPIVSGRFEGDAIASSRAFGMPGLRFVMVPRIYRNLSDEESLSQTEPAFDSLVETLTTNSEEDLQLDTGASTAVERFEGDDRYDAVLRMNEEYTNRDWGDSLPLFTATQSAVDELLKGTNLPPDHVVCDMPPRFRTRHGGKDSDQRGDGGRQARAYAGDHWGRESPVSDGHPGWQVASDVYQSPRPPSRGERSHGQRHRHQLQVGVRTGALE